MLLSVQQDNVLLERRKMFCCLKHGREAETSVSLINSELAQSSAAFPADHPETLHNQSFLLLQRNKLNYLLNGEQKLAQHCQRRPPVRGRHQRGTWRMR